MKNELSKEDQERIEKAAVDYGTSFPGAFEAGAKYEHPIAYNKGYEDGRARKKDDLRDDPAYLASVNNFKVQCEHNNRYYNEGFNEALEEVERSIKFLMNKQFGLGISSDDSRAIDSKSVFEEIEKLKR